MSLDGFGKLICPRSECGQLQARLAQRVEKHGAVLAVDVLDEDDRDSLDSVSELEGDGLYFALYSSPGATDATALWIEAMKNRVDSRLACLARLLIDNPECVGGGLALVDGGIDEVLLVQPEDCVAAILADTSVPWDQGPNRLYVWTNTR
jgi:hypothetical protein